MEWWKATGICAVFFFILSPGFLLTLPPKSGSEKGLIGKGLFHSLQTSNASIFVHTIVFLVVVGALLWYLDSGSSSGGSGGPAPTPTVDDDGDAPDGDNGNEGE